MQVQCRFCLFLFIRYVSTIDTYEVKEANGSSFDLAPPSLDGDDSDNERTKTPEVIVFKYACISGK